MRFLNDGRLRRASEVVRIEEMVNYFDYSVRDPREAVLSRASPSIPRRGTPRPRCCISASRAGLPQGARAAAGESVLLLDVSGLDGGSRQAAASSRNRFVDAGQGDDEANASDRRGCPAMPASCWSRRPATRRRRSRRLSTICRRADRTAGGEGIRRAYSELAEANLIKGGRQPARSWATDGDFNVGITDPQQLEDFVARKRESVTLTVLASAPATSTTRDAVAGPGRQRQRRLSTR